MWRRILAYILFGLGILTVTFFRRYSGEVIPYPFLFYLLGLSMFVGGLLFLRFTPTAKDFNLQKQITKTIIDLKTNGDKIPVELSNCEIKEQGSLQLQGSLHRLVSAQAELLHSLPSRTRVRRNKVL